MKIKEIKKVINFKAGYQVRHEVIDDSPYGGDGNLLMKSAYNPDGHYIGDTKTAHRLCQKWGIRPELASPDNSVCSVGFCEKEQKWFGWSHRAIYGFGVGHEVKEGDCAAEYLTVGFKAKTLDDCRKMAVAFARSVS